MIYDVDTGKPVEKGFLEAYSKVPVPIKSYVVARNMDIAFLEINAFGNEHDPTSVAEAEYLLAVYRAAPQMLEALKAFAKIDEAINYDRMIQGNITIPKAWIRCSKLAKAAIAAAEGKES